jgi:hypothetical protein
VSLCAVESNFRAISEFYPEGEDTLFYKVAAL